MDALDVPPAAVAMPQPHVGDRVAASSGHGLVVRGEQGEPILGVREVGQPGAGQLRGGVAEQSGDRRRLVADHELRVGQRDQVRGVLHQGPEAGLAACLRCGDPELTGPARGLEPAEQQAGHQRGEDHHEQRLGVGHPSGAVCWPPGAGSRPRPPLRAGGPPRRRAHRRRSSGTASSTTSARTRSAACWYDGQRGGHVGVRPQLLGLVDDQIGGRVHPASGIGERAVGPRAGSGHGAPQLRILGGGGGVEVGQQHVGPGPGVGLVAQRHDAEPHAQRDVEGEHHRDPAAPRTAAQPADAPVPARARGPGWLPAGTGGLPSLLGSDAMALGPLIALRVASGERFLLSISDRFVGRRTEGWRITRTGEAASGARGSVRHAAPATGPGSSAAAGGIFTLSERPLVDKCPAREAGHRGSRTA